LACAIVVAGLVSPARAQTPPGPKPKPPATQPAKPQPKPKPKPVPLTPAQLARRAPGRPGSFEVAAGAAWLGPGSLGSSDAHLTANGSAAPYTYFVTSGTLGGAPALDARVTYNLSRRLAIEGGVNYSAPSVRLKIGSDSEGASASGTPSETMSQYFLDASVLLFVPRLSFARGRGRAFVGGGGGYLRQLHEGRFNVESGTVYNAGGGLKYYFKPRPRGFLKGFGLRVDLRAYYKTSGYSLDGAHTWTAALGAAGIVAF
jgi:hypothetical protein